MIKPAIFLERDGILNRPRVEGGKAVPPTALKEFEICVEVLPLLRRLKEQGFLLIATTNQPGISRGYLSRFELDRMHALVRQIFPLDDLFFCPHDEMDHCPCRKPRPGLLIEAAYKWHIDLPHSFVISDKWQDAEAARWAGCTSVMIRSASNGAGHHDCVVPDFRAAVEKVLYLHSMNYSIED
ncbi:HAD-IIIA family hydrolase [Fontisphaera persica]|jgi:D-glycero-D-manno-heptose 1,7-bisphosphate phosphatase|uniref:D-glycero-alpha-D-manno-heptose-1,7-bisphosphate 7-phosphatase n=1 Tax=Fontisphaera persica TaxID=2974023 RepID=UPI0024C0922B|nr:HAD-IIIA family hydrolase [Fontisphaera persica]WCJ59849.1 HAD-IIIA family hydrolase [Fontisphaera persica]